MALGLLLQNKGPFPESRDAWWPPGPTSESQGSSQEGWVAPQTGAAHSLQRTWHPLVHLWDLGKTQGEGRVAWEGGQQDPRLHLGTWPGDPCMTQTHGSGLSGALGPYLIL